MTTGSDGGEGERDHDERGGQVEQRIEEHPATRAYDVSRAAPAPKPTTVFASGDGVEERVRPEQFPLRHQPRHHGDVGGPREVPDGEMPDATRIRRIGTERCPVSSANPIVNANAACKPYPNSDTVRRLPGPVDWGVPR